MEFVNTYTFMIYSPKKRRVLQGKKISKIAPLVGPKVRFTENVEIVQPEPTFRGYSVNTLNIYRRRSCLSSLIRGIIVHRAVCLFTHKLLLTLTHCAYPRRDGQVELNRVDGFIPRWSPIQVLTVLDVE